MNAPAVCIAGAVAGQIERAVGRAQRETALVALLRGVAEASAPGSPRAVLAGDYFSCFVNVPIATGLRTCLRAYWYTESGTGKKVVTRIERG